MDEKELDPLRDRMIAALYGELPPEEEEEFLTEIGRNEALRAEWAEMQEARGFLQAADAAEPAADFAFQPPAPARAAGPGRPRASWSALLLRPAFGFAFAAAACGVLLLAGLRVDRVASGFAVRFGGADAPVEPATADLPGEALEAPRARTVSVHEGAAPGLTSFVTRAELATFAQEFMAATEARIEENEERRLGQTVYLLRDYFEAMEERRDRDRLELSSEMNQALLRLARADMIDTGRWTPAAPAEDLSPSNDTERR